MIRLSIFLLILMATTLIAQQLPTPAAVTDPAQLASKPKDDLQSFSIEKLYSTRLVSSAHWSPDGKQVAFVSNISGRNNIWLVPAEGGWPVQLTISDQRQSGLAWAPDGKWIAYQSDTDGNEQWDIYLVSTENGGVVNLTNTPYIAEEGPTWSPDGRKLAYMVKAQTAPNFEIDIYNVLTKQVAHLTPGTPKELNNVNPLWSPDGKSIAYTQFAAKGTDSNVFVADVATGKAVNVTEHAGDAHHSASGWSPDGKKLLITSDAGNGYSNAGLVDVATKKIEWLTQDKWEVESGTFSPDGKRLTWTANVDGNTDVFVYDLASRKAEVLPVKKGVNFLAGNEPFTRDGSRLLYYYNGPDSPNDVWVYSLAEKRSWQVTHSLVGGLQAADMVEPYLVHYPSRDGKFTISAFVYVPHNILPNNRYPAMVYIHGGPTSQTVNSFNRFVQYIVNQGYLVIAPNYRGSTGYGKDFQQANLFDMGGGDLQDNLAAADWIKGSPYVDPSKLIVMGGSYGGYMSMMALTKSPETWAAGVPIVPFVNWFTELEHEDPLLREIDLATMGDPVKNKALYEERSPINFIDRVKAPMLLLAGGNDPRCPKEEAQQVADAITKRGGVADLKIYANEGHGFARVENQIDAYKRVAQFLKKYVPSPGCGCTIYE